MGTSRLRTPSGARLNRGTPRASRSPRWRRQKNLEGRKKFQGVSEFFPGKNSGWLTLSVRAPCRPSLARAAARLPTAPFPYATGHLRLAIFSRDTALGLGWPLPSSRVRTRPCPKPPAPCQRPAAGAHAPSPGGFFLRAFARAAPLLPFVGESGLPLRRLVGGPDVGLLRACGLSTCGRSSMVFRRPRDRLAARHPP
jgi:hypothetical protein